MLFDGRTVNIANYTAEAFEDEMIIYNEDAKNVSMLNQTAVLVWNEIIERYQEKKDVFSEEIVQKIIQIYDISEYELDEIRSDVKETIDSFFSASLLVDISDNFEEKSNL